MNAQIRRRRGTIVAFFLIMVAVLTTSLLTSMAVTSGSDTQVASLTLKRDQAFYAAEAGMQRALWNYKQNNAWRASSASPVVGTLTNGSAQYTYSVTCVDNGANSVKIVSTVQTPTSPAASQATATVSGGGAAPGLAIGNNLQDSGTLTVTGEVQAKGNVSRSGTMILSNIAGQANSDLQAMGFLNSSGTFTVPGNLLLNGAITSSGTVNVAGNAEAGAALSHSGTWNVAGSTNGWDNPNLVINTPTVDTATLIAQATTDGTVIAGGSKSNYVINFNAGSNHVVCVNGNLTLSGTTTIIGTGTLIVEGTLSASGSMGTAGSPLAMNLVTTGDDTMSGNFYINGALCVGGSLSKSGFTGITGVVVVQNSLNGSGNVTITYAQPPSFVHYSGGGGGAGGGPTVQTFTGPIY